MTSPSESRYSYITEHEYPKEVWGLNDRLAACKSIKQLSETCDEYVLRVRPFDARSVRGICEACKLRMREILDEDDSR